MPSKPTCVLNGRPRNGCSTSRVRRVNATDETWPEQRQRASETGFVGGGEDTKRFIDRHVRPGEKRPSAPSVRRDTGAHQARRKTGS
jgi:hypothetical protein